MAVAPITFRDAALAAGLGAGAAVLMAFGLSAASTPGDLKPRLGALEARSNRARALLTPSPTATFPGGICAGDSTTAAKSLSDGVSTLAAQTNLSLEFVDTHREPDAGGPGALTPIRLRVTATGSYEGAVMFLAALSRQRPAVFADNVDLTSSVSTVKVSFSGRAFCAG